MKVARRIMANIVGLLLTSVALPTHAGAPISAETIVTAPWERSGPGGFNLNDDAGWRMAPEDFDLGEEILIPDAARRGFQFFNRSTRTWREISVGKPEERHTPWKAVRDGGGLIYYLPVSGLQGSEIRVVPSQGGATMGFGGNVLRGYASYLATNGADRLSVVDARGGIAIFTLQGNRVRYADPEPRTATVSHGRDGVAYTVSGELLAFYRVWETKKPPRYGIQIFSRDGDLVRDVPGAHLPRFIGVDRLGHVYTVDQQYRTVRVVTADGRLKEDLTLPTPPGPVIADMNGEKNVLKVDADGTLYQLLGLQKKGLVLRRLRHP